MSGGSSQDRSAGPLLEVRDLSVSLGRGKERLKVLHEVSFSLEEGACLSLVGESGCGKTMTALAVMGLLPGTAPAVDGGRIRFRGEDLVRADPRFLRSLRGRRMAMIFQDAASAMNPFLRVSEQLAEGLIHHTGAGAEDALKRGVELMERVGIPDAASRIHDYPHRFSGGMLQRIMIAMALMTGPDLIIADEPTSALDVTIQAQTLRLLDEVRASSGTAVLLITHDLGVVAGRSDRTAVMYAGRIVEQGPTASVLRAPVHPYMEALLRSNPSMAAGKAERLAEIPGQPPHPGARGAGCAFAQRCPCAIDRCQKEAPPLEEVEESHRAACWKR